MLITQMKMRIEQELKPRRHNMDHLEEFGHLALACRGKDAIVQVAHQAKEAEFSQEIPVVNDLDALLSEFPDHFSGSVMEACPITVLTVKVPLLYLHEHR